MALCLAALLNGLPPGAATARVSQGPAVHFPADQAAHSSAQSEWWYIVGHLQSAGHSFGYQVTVFKFAHMTPPGMSTPISLFRTDLAITDENGHAFHHRITYFFPQSANASTRALSIKVGSVVLSGPPSAMRLQAHFGRYSVDLLLRSVRQPLYVGGSGLLTFGNGYTYYYSLTDLASTGSIQSGTTRFSVSGVSWLDHQWGNWSWSTIRGWTWTAIQLDSGVQLSAFDFRGTTQSTRQANIILPDGHQRTLHSLTLTPSGTWHSPHSGAAYPARETVRIPALRATLHIVPTVQDQEMTVPSQLRISYWEGSSRVSGTYLGKRVTGKAYLELTGYTGSSLAG